MCERVVSLHLKLGRGRIAVMGAYISEQGRREESEEQ
jgi:hypothetical protein